MKDMEHKLRAIADKENTREEDPETQRRRVLFTTISDYASRRTTKPGSKLSYRTRKRSEEADNYQVNHNN